MAATTIARVGATATAAETTEFDSEEALERLRTSDPPLFLSPSPELSGCARAASRHLFSSLLPFCPKPKPPFDHLFADEGFDAEQIWSQIDLISRPIVSLLRREIKRIERDPPAAEGSGDLPVVDVAVNGEKGEEEELNDEGEGEEEEEDDDEEEGEEEEEGAEEEAEEEERGVEDKFLKMKELEEYMEMDEEREFGKVKEKGRREEEDDDDEENDDDEVDFGFGDLGGFDGEDSNFAENARYEDFFKEKRIWKRNMGDRKKNQKSSKKVRFLDDTNEELEMEDEQMDDHGADAQDSATLSTHEKHLLKLHTKIEQMEKANLEPKSWTMQGEVTASKRPKNSALEVDLDFEHNARPVPVITEEVTASLEDLIKKRIIEGQFDDVQRAPALPTKPPKELKELDENKSKKGLAEIYEEEYAQKTGLVSAPLSSSEEQKKEASMLFKKLCIKLDALSHFHFAPKPVIEDLSIQANVPALAMEEIAPLAVSDAAMLAPEEVFKGKGDIKEETELTQTERKRRRANKKRKFKAETAKRAAKKSRQNTALTHSDEKTAGKEDS